MFRGLGGFLPFLVDFYQQVWSFGVLVFRGLSGFLLFRIFGQEKLSVHDFWPYEIFGNRGNHNFRSINPHKSSTLLAFSMK